MDKPARNDEKEIELTIRKWLLHVGIFLKNVFIYTAWHIDLAS